MTSFVKITYYHTLYQREVTSVTDEISFDEDGYVRFACVGHKEAIEIKHIRKITGIEQ